MNWLCGCCAVTGFCCDVACFAYLLQVLRMNCYKIAKDSSKTKLFLIVLYDSIPQNKQKNGQNNWTIYTAQVENRR